MNNKYDIKYITRKISKRFLLPPAIKVWTNNLYSFNVNLIKSLPIANGNVNKIIKHYFNINLLDNNLNKLSLNNILISKSEVKHLSKKIVITIYVFNKKNFLILKNLKDIYRFLVKKTSLINILSLNQKKKLINEKKKINFSKKRLNYNKFKFASNNLINGPKSNNKSWNISNNFIYYYNNKNNYHYYFNYLKNNLTYKSYKPNKFIIKISDNKIYKTNYKFPTYIVKKKLLSNLFNINLKHKNLNKNNKKSYLNKYNFTSKFLSKISSKLLYYLNLKKISVNNINNIEKKINSKNTINNYIKNNKINLKKINFYLNNYNILNKYKLYVKKTTNLHLNNNTKFNLNNKDSKLIIKLKKLYLFYSLCFDKPLNKLNYNWKLLVKPSKFKSINKKNVIVNWKNSLLYTSLISNKLNLFSNKLFRIKSKNLYEKNFFHISFLNASKVNKSFLFTLRQLYKNADFNNLVKISKAKSEYNKESLYNLLQLLKRLLINERLTDIFYKEFSYNSREVIKNHYLLNKFFFKYKNSFVTNDCINNIENYKFFIRNLLYTYKINYIKNYINKEFQYIHYLKIVIFNNIIFKNWFLYPLKTIISKIYNKNIEFNFVNLKYSYLNSDIFAQAVALRLKYYNPDMVLIKAMDMIPLSKLNYYTFDRNSNINKYINYHFNRSLYLTNTLFSKHNKINDINNINIINKKKLKIKRLNYIQSNTINFIKYKSVFGVKLETSGRLSKRSTASKSTYSSSSKGTLKNIIPINHLDTSVIIKNNGLFNLQHSKINSKTRNGSFGIKGWINNI